MLTQRTIKSKRDFNKNFEEHYNNNNNNNNNNKTNNNNRKRKPSSHSSNNKHETSNLSKINFTNKFEEAQHLQQSSSLIEDEQQQQEQQEQPTEAKLSLVSKALTSIALKMSQNEAAAASSLKLSATDLAYSSYALSSSSSSASSSALSSSLAPGIAKTNLHTRSRSLAKFQNQTENDSIFSDDEIENESDSIPNEYHISNSNNNNTISPYVDSNNNNNNSTAYFDFIPGQKFISESIEELLQQHSDELSPKSTVSANNEIGPIITSASTTAGTMAPFLVASMSAIDMNATPTAESAILAISSSAPVSPFSSASILAPAIYSNETYTSTSYWNYSGYAIDDDFLYRHSLVMTIVYCIAYMFVFFVGLIGNSFVIAVVLRAPRMRTVTNYFIVNLAIADILVIVFCLPATLMSNIFVPWMLGWLMCKTVPYIQGVSVAASVYSLIAVSLDRFIAIWWPLKQMTKSRARFMILCIWIIALGTTIPWVLFFDLVPAGDSFPPAPDMYLCQEVWPPGTNGNLYFLLAHLVACYLLPMSLITLCYVLIWIKVSTRSIPGDSKDAQMDRMQQKSKVKVIKMLVAVVILFVLSWLPLYAIFARIKFGGEISLEESEILNKVTPIAQWLGASNSCINPILYAFFNKKYRRGFVAITKSRSCCGRLRYYDNVAIVSSTTSTRKSSHYHHHNSSRKSPSSPGLRKTNAVSYIYEHNSLRRHNLIMKQDSNLSQQMLLKQDSHGSRQYLIKQESASSDGSRRLLCQQDSNGSKMSLSKQDSVVSYVEAKRSGHAVGSNQDRSQDTFSMQDSMSIDSRRGTIGCSPPQNGLLEYKRQKFVKQDSVISFADQRPEPRRHQLVKQDSVISFADQRKGILSKQDSIIACPPNRTAGDGTGHHVSILKKTDSQLSTGFASPRRNIELYE